MNHRVLDNALQWFHRFISPMRTEDLYILVLWAAHTHLVEQTYTTPRLIIDSPVPGSGKTTVLEHLQHLCFKPVQMAAISSSPLLVRIVEQEPRTLLIDEADRTLNPKKDETSDFLAVINSGYKRGGSRPVLTREGDNWVIKEMPTYAPVAMAGNNPLLPDDTRQRTIRVLLMPDTTGQVTPSDWEDIEPEADFVGNALADWAEENREAVAAANPELPDGCYGRMREVWKPLLRIAHVAGGEWPARARELVNHAIEEREMEKADGMERIPPALHLLRDIADVWPKNATFIPTDNLIGKLIAFNPDMWGEYSDYGKALTTQRLGRMLTTSYKVNSVRRPDGQRERGYRLSSLVPAMRRMGVRLPAAAGPDPLDVPDRPGEPGEPDHRPNFPSGPAASSSPSGQSGGSGSVPDTAFRTGSPGLPGLSGLPGTPGSVSDADRSTPQCQVCGEPMSYAGPNQTTHPTCTTEEAA